MKTTRKLTMAAIMVMVALLAFVGSTFAWMTVANNITTADPVTGTVQGVEGIYARLKTSDSMEAGSGWTQQLDLSVINKEGGAFYNKTLAPVCIADNSSFEKLNDTSSTTADHFIAAEANTDFIEFEIDVTSYSSTKVGATVVIDSTSSGDAQTAVLSCARVLVSNDSNTYGVRHVNSIGILNSGSDFNNTNGLPSTVNSSTLYNFYHSTNPNRQTFVAAGILNDLGQITEDGYQNYAESTTGRHYVQFDGLNKLYNDTELLNLTASATLGANFGTLTIRIYIEGWDSLCANYIAGTNINVKITLTPIA